MSRLGLRPRRFPLSDIPIPIWLRFEDLLEAAARPTRHEDQFAKYGLIQAAVDTTVPAMVAKAVTHAYEDRFRATFLVAHKVIECAP